MGAIVSWLAVALLALAILNAFSEPLRWRLPPLLRTAGRLAFPAMFAVLGAGAVAKGNALIAALEFLVLVVLLGGWLLHNKRRRGQSSE